VNENVLNDNIDTIIKKSFLESRHMLLLYARGVNRDLIQASFFSSAKKDENLLYISEEEFELVRSRFNRLNVFPLIIQPQELKFFIENVNKDKSFRIIVEGAFEHTEIHRLLNFNKNNIVLCMYKLGTLNVEQITELVEMHKKLILSTPSVTILSSSSFKDLNIEYSTIERFVKEYLDIIVLSLIASRPMCGIEILDVIHREFNVLLSPGTIYPLLHKLKNDGFLEREYVIKKKIYKIARGNEKNIRNILDRHMIANEFLNEFLKSTALGENTK
jgi:DNA-binding PadR family transcriptional regulator